MIDVVWLQLHSFPPGVFVFVSMQQSAHFLQLHTVLMCRCLGQLSAPCSVVRDENPNVVGTIYIWLIIPFREFKYMCVESNLALAIP